jgi:glycosyltransferase involved in cell wall biosynthesis
VTGPRVLVVVGADSSTDTTRGPRRDYAVLATLLGATIVDRRSIERSRIARAIRAVAGTALALAWVAFRDLRRHDAVVTDGEHVGIPLAVLMRVTRSKTHHVTIGHRLSAPKKRLFFSILRCHDAMGAIVLHSRRQHDYANKSLGIPAEKLALVPYHVDTEFWSPRAASEERLVVSVGLEHRDYQTLFRAASAVPANFVVAAASLWSRHELRPRDVPSNVKVAAFDYHELRDLYARAAIVVVPLVDVDNQAGITTILEAMAMGKPVIVSQSRGQTDVVEDRRGPERGVPVARPRSLLRLIAADQNLTVQPNGFYVPPGDAEALARAIAFLLDHPDERARLGVAGRQLAEQLLTVDAFAARLNALVLAGLRGDRESRRAQRVEFG